MGYKSLATGTGSKDSMLCPNCDIKHDLDDCKIYLSYSVEDRSKFLGRKRLCYGCYKPVSHNHSAKSCTQRRKCKKCEGNHPTGLHGFKFRKKKDENNVENNMQKKIDSNQVEKVHEVKSNATVLGTVISMCVIPVKVTSTTSGKSIFTLAMLDSCSQASFVTDNLVKHLNANGIETSLTINTITGANTITSQLIDGLVVELWCRLLWTVRDQRKKKGA